jgi:hypothetical protein
MIDRSAFLHSGISQIAVDEGNSHFHVSNDLLTDVDGVSVIS